MDRREWLGQPVCVFVAGVKCGLGHLQRREDALVQERAERFPETISIRRPRMSVERL